MVYEKVWLSGIDYKTSYNLTDILTVGGLRPVPQSLDRQNYSDAILMVILYFWHLWRGCNTTIYLSSAMIIGKLILLVLHLCWIKLTFFRTGLSLIQKEVNILSYCTSCELVCVDRLRVGKYWFLGLLLLEKNPSKSDENNTHANFEHNAAFYVRHRHCI